MSSSSWGPSMLTKHNTYGVLTLHPLCQAVAKLVGFFEGILTICSCYSQAAQTECLSSYNWLFWIMKFTLLLPVCKFALQSRILDKKKKKTWRICEWFQFKFLPLPLEVLRPRGAPTMGPPPRPVSRSTAALFTDMEKFLCKYRQEGWGGGGQRASSQHSSWHLLFIS